MDRFPLEEGSFNRAPSTPSTFSSRVSTPEHLDDDLQPILSSAAQHATDVSPLSVKRAATAVYTSGDDDHVGQASVAATAAASVAAAVLKKQPRDDSHNPVKTIENMIIESGQRSIPLETIEKALSWEENYDESLRSYLQGYQSLFIVSPVDDVVALRQLSLDTTSRRTMKPKKRQNLSHAIGSVSYSSIAEAFDIDKLESLYENRGLEVTNSVGVLHVRCSSFDLFIFSMGCVVWWGMDREHHWIVDEDFLCDNAIVVRSVRERHWQKDIVELFPIWCTYQERHGMELDDDGIAAFTEHLPFDHYIIPDKQPQRSQVMLAVSCALARSAKVDFLEYITVSSSGRVLNLPEEPQSMWDYFSAKREIAKLEGELRTVQMMMTSLQDIPEAMWEMYFLRPFFVLSNQQNSVERRLEWFLARSEALFEQLESNKRRRHRLFMLSSDVFLIVLLVLDVVVMSLRLIVKMFFSVDEVQERR